MSRFRSALAACLATCLLTLVPSDAPADTGAAPAPARAAAGLDPSRLLTQYAADAWGLDDGLPQSVVEAIARTGDGHIWLGTQEGLARFDGARFVVVDAARGLPDPRVLALAGDPRPGAEGSLWVGTRDGGLVYIDRDLRVMTYGEEQGLPGGTVAALVVESSGRLWVGTRDGLCVLDPPALRTGGDDGGFADTGRIHCTARGLDEPYVRRLALARDGGVWIGTRAGLHRLADGRITSLAPRGGLLAQPITALHEDADGGLWVGTLAGPAYLVEGELVRRPELDGLAGVEVSAVLEDRAGSVWLGTYGNGLVRTRPGRDPEIMTTVADADASIIRALLQDPEGSLWMGTMGGGLARLRDARFTPFGAPEGLGADRVFTVAADRAGAVWAGTAGGGIARIDGGRVVRRLTMADGLPSNDVASALVDSAGALWIGLDGAGLCRWDGDMRCFSEADGLPDPFVLALFQDDAGTLWVGGDGGLSRWTGDGFAAPASSAAPAAPVVSIAQTPDGALWAGTFGDGLFRMAGGRFTHHADIAGAVVLSLHAADDGALWAGTEGDGLVRIRSTPAGLASDRFTTRQGLLSDAVLQVLEDGSGHLWLTSNRGIVRVAVAELNRVAEGRTAVARTTVYGRADGLRSAEANGGGQPAGAVGTDGALWFPTTSGVVTIDPGHMRTNALPPPVAIQRLLANDRPVGIAAGETFLAAGSTELKFEYAGLALAAPQRVRHRYRLEGRDDHWSDAGARREAFYTDLAPGSYVFRVQAANEDGVWNRAGASLAFTLRPHFWQTRWFAILCGLIVVGSGFAASAARTRQLRHRAAHLEGVVDERTQALREALGEVQSQKSVIEGQAAELTVLNADLEARVREQLAALVRKSRLQKYFPAKVVSQILEQDSDVTVSAERKRATILFSDLTGFTALSDATPPDVVTRLLNEYLTEMVALIESHGGALDKFMGDGLMVHFGAADDMAPAEQAVQATSLAVAMQRALAALRSKWEAEGITHRLELRVGINQDDVTVGNFGSDDLLEYTAIGQGVNLASRLEGACAPGRVLVSFPVYALTKERFDYGQPEVHTLKGISEPVAAYSLDPRVTAGGVRAR